MWSFGESNKILPFFSKILTINCKLYKYQMQRFFFVRSPKAVISITVELSKLLLSECAFVAVMTLNSKTKSLLMYTAFGRWPKLLSKCNIGHSKMSVCDSLLCCRLVTFTSLPKEHLKSMQKILKFTPYLHSSFFMCKVCLIQ